MDKLTLFFRRGYHARGRGAMKFPRGYGLRTHAASLGKARDMTAIFPPYLW